MRSTSKPSTRPSTPASHHHSLRHGRSARQRGSSGSSGSSRRSPACARAARNASGGASVPTGLQRAAAGPGAVLVGPARESGGLEGAQQQHVAGGAFVHAPSWRARSRKSLASQVEALGPRRPRRRVGAEFQRAVHVGRAQPAGLGTAQVVGVGGHQHQLVRRDSRATARPSGRPRGRACTCGPARRTARSPRAGRRCAPCPPAARRCRWTAC